MMGSLGEHNPRLHQDTTAAHVHPCPPAPAPFPQSWHPSTAEPWGRRGRRTSGVVPAGGSTRERGEVILLGPRNHPQEAPAQLTADIGPEADTPAAGAQGPGTHSHHPRPQHPSPHSPEKERLGF